jgi:hypothetical protein
MTATTSVSLTSVSLFRRHCDISERNSGQGRKVEGKTRKRSKVGPGLSCVVVGFKFQGDKRTHNLRVVRVLVLSH